MSLVSLSAVDLALAALLVILLAAVSLVQDLGVSRRLLVAGLRTTLQLLLLGLVLKSLFAHVHPVWIGLMSLVMLLAAGREVMARQTRRFAGWQGFGIGTLSMFVSSFAITLFALTAIIRFDPWYEPQYAIPLLGMLLGNTMNGIAIALNRLTQASWDQKGVIEARLMLGQDWRQALETIQKDSIRSGLIPITNAMAVAGVVSLPGMMTGQILAGSPPLEAVKYQILIMFLIAAGTGFGTVAAVWWGGRRLFDERQRLRLDRLKK